MGSALPGCCKTNFETPAVGWERRVRQTSQQMRWLVRTVVVQEAKRLVVAVYKEMKILTTGALIPGLGHENLVNYRHFPESGELQSKKNPFLLGRK